jgi:hypothetical protein
MILRSGKHKGKKWTDVQTYDPGYIRWVRENRPEMLKSHSKPKGKDKSNELDEMKDNKSLNSLRHQLLKNPGKLEDAF